MIPLTQEQFRDALRKGKGRALLHVREFGCGGLEEDILHACEQSIAYDTQIEGTRSGWMYEIVTDAGLVEAAKSRVLAALDRPIVEPYERFWDVAQLYCLAAAFAQDGHADARDAVYRKFDRKEFPEVSYGGFALIMADGLTGFLHAAGVVGDRIANEPDYWDGGECEYLFDEACKHLGQETVTDALATAAEKNENCRAFHDAVQKHRDDEQKYKEEREEAKRQGKCWPSRKIPGAAVVLQAIETSETIEAPGYDYPRMRLPGWGQTASEQDVQTVFEHLLTEHRPEQLQRLFQIFYMRTMPRVDDRILQLAHTGPAEVRDACLRALDRVTDKRVHQLGRELLSQNSPPPEAIGLFRNNYEPQDHVLIESALPRPGNGEQSDGDFINGIVLDLNKIADKAGPEFFNCLLWVYEHAPCAHCRESAVRRMVDLQIAPQAILRECLADSYEDTRKLAAAALAGTVLRIVSSERQSPRHTSLMS